MPRLLRDIVLLAATLVALLFGALELGRQLAPHPQDVDAAIGAATRPLRSAAGRSFYAVLKTGGLLVEEPLLVRAVAAAITMLPEDRRPAEVHVLALATPNALAAPDGAIYLTAGLLATLASLQQLAAIVSHEVGHVALQHSSEALVRELGIAGIMGAAGLADAAAARVLASVIGASFSRDAEREADEFAHAALAAAGIDPAVFADALELLAADAATASAAPDASGENGQARGAGRAVLRYLDTHPGIDQRISDARAASRVLARGAWRPTPAEPGGGFSWSAVQRVAAALGR